MEIWFIFTILSAIFIGVRDIVSKKFLKKLNLRPIEILFDENFLFFTFIGCFLFWLIDFQNFTDFAIVVISKSLILTFVTFIYFYLLKLYDISNVAPLMNLSPVFLLVLSSIFLSEVISTFQVIGISVIILATYFLEFNFHIHHHGDKSKSHRFHFKKFIQKLKAKKWDFLLLAISMLVLISVCAILDKVILSKTDAISNLFYTTGFSTVFTSCYLLYRRDFVNTVSGIIKNPARILITTLTSLGNFFAVTAIAIPTALISLIVPVKRCSTLFASLFGGILFHEKHLLKKVVAVIIMLFGIFLIIL